MSTDYYCVGYNIGEQWSDSKQCGANAYCDSTSSPAKWQATVGNNEDWTIK